MIVPPPLKVGADCHSAFYKWGGAMNAFENAVRLVGVLLVASALCPGLAWSQDNLSQSLTLNTTAVAKVQTVRGTARIEHSTAVLVQANLPTTGADQTKVGDLVYRGDKIQTGADGALGITFVDGSTFNVSSDARMDVDEFLYDPNGLLNSTLNSPRYRNVQLHCGPHCKNG